MSCLENDKLKERLAEEFEYAVKDNAQLTYKLGRTFLTYDEVYKKLEERFFEREDNCFDIEQLAYDVFNIEIVEEE